MLMLCSVQLWKEAVYFCKNISCSKIVNYQYLSIYETWSVIFRQTSAQVKVVFLISTQGLVAWLAPSSGSN